MFGKNAAGAPEKAKEGLLETVRTVLWALVIAGIFRTLFFQPFWIPSGSMKDTLLIGDFLFVNKMAYGYSRYSCPLGLCPISGRVLGAQPERGDVVVFRHPYRGTDYIKRLIGLPGDRVQMRAGTLYINDAPAPQTPIEDFVEIKEPQGSQQSLPRCANEPVEPGGPCLNRRARERLPNGVEHDVLDIGRTAVDDTPVYTVPAGHYFFMGDNRDNSLDSRVPALQGGVEFVPAEYLIGRADRVIFSSAGRSLFFVWTWRPDRFFRAID